MTGKPRTFAVLRTSRQLGLIGTLAAASLAVSSPAFAASTYSENVSGDLSSNGLSPTAINLAFGNNMSIIRHDVCFPSKQAARRERTVTR